MQGLIPCTFLLCNRTFPPLLPQLLARSSKEILLHDLRLMLEAGLGEIFSVQMYTPLFCSCSYSCMVRNTLQKSGEVGSCKAYGKIHAAFTVQ